MDVVPVNSYTQYFDICVTSNGKQEGHALDSYHDVSIEIEQARLDNFAMALQEIPDSKGYILAYAGRHARTDEAQARAKRAKNYLVSTRGIEASRIITMNGGHREDLTVELYIVPDGAPPPIAAPTVDPKEVQLIKNHSTTTSNCKPTRPRRNSQHPRKSSR